MAWELLRDYNRQNKEKTEYALNGVEKEVDWGIFPV
jgi:hypothetical protein